MLCLLLVLDARAQKPVRFPTVSAYNLDKVHVTLPADLDGERNLLLLSFASEQAPQVESWNAVAQALEHMQPHFRTYRLPVAETENALYRWWGNASLRGNETDPEMWRWTVPLYLDTAAFRAALGIPGSRNAVVLLVDKSGRVLWRAAGASTPELRSALTAAAAAR